MLGQYPSPSPNPNAGLSRSRQTGSHDDWNTSFKTEATLNLTTAAAALEDGIKRIAAGATYIDCAPLTQFDSSALAVLIAWRRAALAHNVTLTIGNMPPQLATLARAYGIDQLLAPASASEHAT